jgi:uncharacterized protein (DUF2062 family)
LEALGILKCRREAFALASLNMEINSVRHYTEGSVALMQQQLVGAMLCCAVLCAMLYAVLYYVMRYNAVLYYAMLCYAMLCYAEL